MLGGSLISIIEMFLLPPLFFALRPMLFELEKS